jgi:CRP-like cAMP-binding protein
MNPAELFRQETNTVQLAPGDFLFREGEKGDKMYVLLEGEVDIFLGDFVFETAGPGSLLGEMALIDDSPRTANAWRRARRAWRKSTDVGFTFSFSRHRTLRRM